MNKNHQGTKGNIVFHDGTKKNVEMFYYELIERQFKGTVLTKESYSPPPTCDGLKACVELIEDTCISKFNVILSCDMSDDTKRFDFKSLSKPVITETDK